LARGEIVRVAIGRASERAARRQWRQAMLRTKGIQIESVRRHCKKRASDGNGKRMQTTFRHQIKNSTQGG